MNVVDLLRDMDRRGASDLFLSVGKVPTMRAVGVIQELEGEAVAEEALTDFLRERLRPGLLETLVRQRDMDVGFSLSETERFRLNLFYQKGCLGMAIRRVLSGELLFEDLGIPAAVQALAEQPRGLVLITGATGSGKSTTMAAMLHHINSCFNRHIVTIEDPIEFIHRDRMSLVSQREVGTDTLTFASALKHVVRQNPDVIFIGEMRDLETIQTAISAAMTGHLVISTVHTVDVCQTLERIINFVPDHLRNQVAQDLALALAGVVSQRLLPRLDGEGLVPVFEILIATPLARRVIAARQLSEIEEILKSGAHQGMKTFTRSLVERCEAGVLSIDVAANGATNRDEFLLAAQGMESGIDSLRGRLDAAQTSPRLTIKSLLRTAVRNGASDLLLSVSCPPMLRVAGELQRFDMPALNGSDTEKLLFSVLTTSQRSIFEAEKEIDFALSVAMKVSDEDREMTTCRFRVNGFFQKGTIGCAFRLISQRIPTAEELMIPAVVTDLAHRHQGLVLVTGPTGHGKSTTLACLIDEINRQRSCHIVTVEDPIEFVHNNKKTVIEQREVHADTKSFAIALKYVLRQDPDVILVGEMRDQETIGAALTAAETGHLVLATLHTNDASQTVDRVIDIFPAAQQNQVRTQLASCLEAIIAQRLLPHKDMPDRRVAAFEVLLGTTAVRTQIRDKRTHQLLATMETAGKDGMVTMDKALQNLYNRNMITRQAFKAVARNPQAL